MISREDVKDLIEQYEAIDQDGSGMIDVQELAGILEEKGLENLQSGNLEKVIAEVSCSLGSHIISLIYKSRLVIT